jgi:DNA repair exonuclease SbcCD ATPase subunit
MSDSENKINEIFIIPDEEKQLRAKRKEQLRLRKEKNKELRAKIARSKAIEKSEQKRTVKKNTSDIDDLKEQLRKIRESNNLSSNNNDKQDDIPISNNEKNDIQKKEVDYNDPTVKKAEKLIKDIDNKVENEKSIQIKKKEENVEKKIEPPKMVINPILFKRRF